MDGLAYRLNEFFPPADRRSLLVDSSAGLVLGAVPGLEDFAAGTSPILTLVDGLVCSPGQLRRLRNRTRQQAALLVRMDWTNTLRKADFVLPPAAPTHLALLTPQDALDLGASGMVASILLGYDEHIEANSMRSLVQWSLEGKTLGLPLVAEIQPTGPRVSHYGKAVELGASYALEGGADMVIVPNPGPASLATLAEFLAVPWLVKASSPAQAALELEEALAAGAAGLWLDQAIFAEPDPAGLVDALARRLHPAVQAGGQDG